MNKILLTGCMLACVLFMSFTFSQPGLQPIMQRGKKVYDTYCLTCHQADGAGVPRMNPPLIKTTYVLGDKKRLINIVLKGFNESVEINGDYYDNPMPAQPQLTDQQVADVLTYVRNSFGNKGTAITLAEVKAERAKLKK
ncbi:cytochrome c [Lacibacter sp. MH-610]|uniref:c-type cytochrome n=1 Tax=Lacibacter sp. MH-610 TaxID=3020883 RepID=UPI0038921DE4